MKKLLSLLPVWSLILLISLNGCGEQNADEERDPTRGNPNGYRWNESIRAANNIVGDELEIARNICTSFISKRQFLAGIPTGLIMDFNVRDIRCGNQDTTVRAQGRITLNRSGGMSFSSLTAGTPVFDDVLSEVHPRLNPFCSGIINGVPTSNTSTQNGIQIQASFFSRNGRNWVQIAEFRPDNRGFWMPFLIERSAVVTENDDRQGFVSIRAINRPCSDLSTTSLLQTWL